MRISEPDTTRHVEPLAAAAFSRAALDGIDWQTVDPTSVVNHRSEELIIAEKGAARELQIIDLQAEPDLARVLESIDLENFGSAARE